MDEERLRFQPAESPFQIGVILKEIFNNLEYPHLANCRQVSKLWDSEASKQLWKVGRIRSISWKWTTVESNLKEAFIRGQQIIKLTDSSKILDVFRSRITSSKDSVILIKIGSPELSVESYDFYRSHYQEVGRIIHGFLTDPILCNLLESIELEFISDMDVVLRLMSEVPNLREFNVNFDFDTFVRTQSLIPKWHRTSPVQKLKLGLVRVADYESDGMDDQVGDSIKTEKFSACLRVILGGCVNLKDLKLEDKTWGTLLDVMDANFVGASIKNPELVEALALESHHFPMDYDINENTPPEKLQMINIFSKLTHLDLHGWGQINLENWKCIISNNYLPKCLKSLKISILEPMLHDSEHSFPERLIHDHLVDAGLDRLQKLTRLRIDLSLEEHKLNVDGHWVEEWEFVDERLALIHAQIAFEDESTIDLRPHKHLQSLTLTLHLDELTNALKIVPPTVKHLDITGNLHLYMYDEDFTRDGALKALSSLERFRISFVCEKCTVAILKHVFAEMKNLIFVQLPRRQFTESQLQEFGLQNITFSHDYFLRSDDVRTNYD